jgi:hypothetical protein
MSPLLGNQEHSLTLSWQNLTVKVKRRNLECDSTGAWLRYLVNWNQAEEVTVLENGEFEHKVLSQVYVSFMGFSSEREAKHAKQGEHWLNQTSTSNRYTALLGHAVAQWLRHYATSWEVTGSRPDEVHY